MNSYEKYVHLHKSIVDVENCIAVLSWDQQTYMPKLSAESRSRQMATLSGIAHKMRTDGKLADLLNEINLEELNDTQRRNVFLSKRALSKQEKFSATYVENLSAAISKAYEKWVKARSENNFNVFEESLSVLVELKKEQAETVGYEEHPYDALMDDFENGLKTSEVEKLFSEVKSELVDFVRDISKRKQLNDAFLYDHFPKDDQWNYGLLLLEQMGYDFNKGRQDVSAHPFTTSFGISDVRVTTRIDENNFNDMTWSCIHEGGHALYEQGLPLSEDGLPVGKPISLGIHESQSRIWENNVGRGLPYWQHNFNELQKRFPSQLEGVNVDQFFCAINTVRPSLIRTNADELTYHFHIMVRFEIEKALIDGSADVKDIPVMWQEKYKQYLGINVPNDSEGCLQDVHWAYASFGYFPTYSIGSFYAAQFHHKAQSDIDSLDEKFRSGNFNEFLEWLRSKIHKKGYLYEADELCQQVTGESLNFQYFMEYVREKYGQIYGIVAKDLIA